MAEPVRVGTLLALVPGIAERLAEHRLLAAWPGIAGAAAARTRAERVEGGLLHVAVHGSAWLHRLGLEERHLLGRCREIAPVRGIRFRLASPLDAPREAEGEVCP
jgi:predicted nucleic acid-binding Zn ribbon protein